MKSTPILMKPEMIRAYMAGRKTQTRRVIKNVPPGTDYYHPGWAPNGDRVFTPYQRTNDLERPKSMGKSVECPCGQPGDELWFRETWATSKSEDDSPPRDTNHHGLPFWYDSDGSVIYTGSTIGGPSFMTRGKTRPSIHMPKWATRHRPKITGIRVERLQDISLADAEEGGLKQYNDGSYKIYTKTTSLGTQNPGASFKSLWDSINGNRPGCTWKDNPFLWVIEFERYTK